MRISSRPSKRVTKVSKTDPDTFLPPIASFPIHLSSELCDSAYFFSFVECVCGLCAGLQPIEVILNEPIKVGLVRKASTYEVSR